LQHLEFEQFFVEQALLEQPEQLDASAPASTLFVFFIFVFLPNIFTSLSQGSPL